MIVLATMFSKVVFPNLEFPEQALPLLINDYANPIVQGFLLVTLLMVGISTMIAVWNSAVSIIVNDIVSRYLAKDKNDKYKIAISRLFLFLIAISTLLLGILFIGNIQSSLLFLSTFTGMVAIPILMSLYWKKYNSLGAIASMVVGLVYCSIGILLDFQMHYISPIGVVLSVIAGYVVTLATANNSKYNSDNDEFFEIVGNKEVIVEE